MVNPEVNLSNSPVIKKPDNPELVKKLVLKCEEYRARLTKYGEYTHPEQILVLSVGIGNENALDSMIKVRLLDEVLEVGEVNTWEFASRTSEDELFSSTREINDAMFLHCIERACVVVDAYCSEDYSSKVYGGTGLPEVNETQVEH